MTLALQEKDTVYAKDFVDVIRVLGITRRRGMDPMYDLNYVSYAFYKKRRYGIIL